MVGDWEGVLAILSPILMPVAFFAGWSVFVWAVEMLVRVLR
jgi:hypothetical protein